jgi:hypothetical protein
MEMNPSVIWLAIELSLAWSFVRPQAMLLQSAGFGGGRLVIESTPQGANIFINGKQEREVTNFTYVVGQGSYTVKVTGGPGNLQCGDKSVTVHSGNVITVHCTAKGWQ